MSNNRLNYAVVIHLAPCVALPEQGTSMVRSSCQISLIGCILFIQSKLCRPKDISAADRDIKLHLHRVAVSSYACKFHGSAILIQTYSCMYFWPKKAGGDLISTYVNSHAILIRSRTEKVVADPPAGMHLVYRSAVELTWLCLALKACVE